MYRFAHCFTEHFNMWAGDRGQCGLLPSRMGQPYQSQPGRIGLPVGIKRQHMLVRQRLHQPVKRRFWKWGLRQQFTKPHWTPEACDLIQHFKCFAYRTVSGRLSHVSSPSLTGGLARAELLTRLDGSRFSINIQNQVSNNETWLKRKHTGRISCIPF